MAFFLSGVLRCAARVTRTPCQFRTAHEVRLWPLKISDSRYYTRTIGELGLPDSTEAKAAILIRLQTTGDKKFKELKLDRLAFFIRGGDEIPISVYEQIFARGSHRHLQPPKGQHQFREILPASTIQRVGFRKERRYCREVRAASRAIGY